MTDRLQRFMFIKPFLWGVLIMGWVTVFSIMLIGSQADCFVVVVCFMTESSCIWSSLMRTLFLRCSPDYTLSAKYCGQGPIQQLSCETQRCDSAETQQPCECAWDNYSNHSLKNKLGGMRVSFLFHFAKEPFSHTFTPTAADSKYTPSHTNSHTSCRNEWNWSVWT